MTLAEASFEDLYELAPCGHLSMTQGGSIIQFNKTFLDWTGFSRSALVGRSILDLLDPAAQLFYETRYLPVLLLEGSVRGVALTIKRADGSRLPLLVNSDLVRGPGGSSGVVRSAIFDATSRVDYETELLAARRSAEASEFQIRVLQGASEAFVASNSLESLAEALAEHARTAFAATAAAVMLLDDDGVLRLVGGVDPVGAELGIHTARPAMQAATSGLSVEITGRGGSDQRFPEVLRALRANRLAAITATPIVAGGSPLGALVCFYAREREESESSVRLQEALARAASMVISRLLLERQLERMALHDSLTGLANRNLIHEQLSKALAAARRSGDPLSIVFLDLDGFKSVNDTAGHSVGDAVLREVATRLRTSVRHEDIVGRLGGDEFVAICVNADQDAATQVADRIRAAIREPIDGVPTGLTITASVGIAVHRGSTAEVSGVDAMITLADNAMYRSKYDGGDRTTALTAR